MLYRFSNLAKRYDSKTVLDIKDISFEKGVIYGLLGPNGAGKTTLLEIMAFLLTPTTGGVEFEDRKVEFYKGDLIKLRKKVVLVQQHPIMFSTSVFSNIEFPMKIRKVPPEVRKRTVEELLKLVGMEDFRDAKAHRLSGGETQRVAIARALACFPSVILLDEPTASVDVENQIIIERIIRDISRKNGITVILTTHDLIQASRVTDKYIFLYEGRLARSKHENLFSGYIEKGPEGKKHCVLQDGLRLMVSAEKTGPVRISINPETLGLNPDNNSLSDCNLLKGKLIQLTDEKDKVRGLVDVGIPLSILISKENSDSLRLKIGEEVSLSCPMEGIEIF